MVFIGLMAHRIGAPHTIMITGALCIAGSLWFTFELPKIEAVMHPIYREMELLPAGDGDLIPALNKKGQSL